MKIKQILSQSRRDFFAILICEHCKNEEKLTTGYDDANYHQNVIPNMKCEECGKKADKDYRPLAPRYPENRII